MGQHLDQDDHSTANSILNSASDTASIAVSNTESAEQKSNTIFNALNIGSETGENVLDANDVQISLGGKQILQGLTLSVKKGETFGLIGPNGAGKTTFIRILTGLFNASGGAIRLLGRDLPDRSVLSRIGYMTQAEAVYGELTVLENLIFFAKLFDLRGKKMSEAIERSIDITVLDLHRDKLARDLSGGLKQRLSLAIALVHEPELLILDEPTVGIDPELRMAFWDHFRELNKKGITILITTHNLDEAARSDRVAMIDEGRVIAHGPVQELLTIAAATNMDEVYIYFRNRSRNNLQKNTRDMP